MQTGEKTDGRYSFSNSALCLPQHDDNVMTRIGCCGEIALKMCTENGNDIGYIANHDLVRSPFSQNCGLIGSPESTLEHQRYSQYSRVTSPSRANYGVSIMRIFKKIDRVITAPHCIWLMMWWIVCETGHRSSVNSPPQSQWRGTLMFSFTWLSKQSWGWWFETPSRSLWRHCNEFLVLLQFSSSP